MGREPTAASWPQTRSETPHFGGLETGLVFTWILLTLIFTVINVPWGAHPTSHLASALETGTMPTAPTKARLRYWSRGEVNLIADPAQLCWEIASETSKS